MAGAGLQYSHGGVDLDLGRATPHLDFERSPPPKPGGVTEEEERSFSLQLF